MKNLYRSRLYYLSQNIKKYINISSIPISLEWFSVNNGSAPSTRVASANVFNSKWYSDRELNGLGPIRFASSPRCTWTYLRQASSLVLLVGNESRRLTLFPIHFVITGRCSAANLRSRLELSRLIVQNQARNLTCLIELNPYSIVFGYVLIHVLIRLKRSCSKNILYLGIILDR